MSTVAVLEAKTRLSELLSQVQEGHEFTITRHGVPMARLVSIDRPGMARNASNQKRVIDETFAALADLRREVS